MKFTHSHIMECWSVQRLISALGKTLVLLCVFYNMHIGLFVSMAVYIQSKLTMTPRWSDDLRQTVISSIHIFSVFMCLCKET